MKRPPGGNVMGRIVNPNPLLSTSSLDYRPEDDQLPRTRCSSRDSLYVCLPVFLRLKRSSDQLEPSSCIPGLLASRGWSLYVGLLPIENFSFSMCSISISHLQLGISDHSRFGMGCNSRAPSTSVDDMG